MAIFLWLGYSSRPIPGRCAPPFQLALALGPWTVWAMLVQVWMFSESFPGLAPLRMARESHGVLTASLTGRVQSSLNSGRDGVP